LKILLLIPGGGRTSGSEGCNWEQSWLAVAQRFCQLDDGVSNRLAPLPDGRKISYAKWRVESLKALGNAIVPQVAIQIMKAIKESERR
jgi:DNA (cytosine-5)-methyltransferase 1